MPSIIGGDTGDSESQWRSSEGSREAWSVQPPVPGLEASRKVRLALIRSGMPTVYANRAQPSRVITFTTLRGTHTSIIYTQ